MAALAHAHEVVHVGLELLVALTVNHVVDDYVLFGTA